MSEYIEVFKRTEVKYILSEKQFQRLMPFLQKYAEIDAYGKTRINNIYFDTPNYQLIRTSLEKPVYKEKLRLRTYGDTSDDTNSFIEIKKKYDGIVYKRRVSGSYKEAYDYLVNGADPLDNSQISKEIEGFIYMYDNLKPAMRISYDRIAMAGIEGKFGKDFRVTFDSNIRWDTDSLDLRQQEHGKEILKPGNYMMEIKVANSMPMELAEKLSELKIFPASFSKYGRGYVDMINRKFVEKKEDAFAGEPAGLAGISDILGVTDSPETNMEKNKVAAISSPKKESGKLSFIEKRLRKKKNRKGVKAYA